VTKSRDQVIELIQKLSEMRIDRGATPSEAEAAAARVQELLHQHQLTMLDVESRTFEEEVVTEEVPVPHEMFPTWMRHLADVLCAAYDCEMLMVKKRYGGSTERSFSFIGVESDVKVVSYLFHTLQDPLFQMSTNAGRELGRKGAELVQYRNSFILGAVWQIHERVKRQKDEQVETSSTAGALVEVKGALVEDYMKRHFPKVRTMSFDNEHDSVAYLEGMIAGRNIEIRPGLEGPGGRLESEKLALPRPKM